MVPLRRKSKVYTLCFLHKAINLGPSNTKQNIIMAKKKYIDEHINKSVEGNSPGNFWPFKSSENLRLLFE